MKRSVAVHVESTSGKHSLLFRLNWFSNSWVIFAAVVTAAIVTIGSTAWAEPPTASGADDPPGRPNVVWIISEDTSKHHLNHFDANGTPTPAIDALAKAGVTFDRAFSCSPVSSIAQTTLITGCYAPRIGTGYDPAIESAMVPAGVKLFPTYLRKQGYYTTNQSKQNYNVRKGPKVWDESSPTAHWKNRVKASKQAPTDVSGPPFFHVQTLNPSQESRPNPASGDAPTPAATTAKAVTLPPYFPNTELFQETTAHFRDRILHADQQVQSIVDELAQAGELENTFVFFFGDHGGVLPRSKGFLFETGLHVPLVVRIPENFRHLVDRERGSRTDAFVEFVDFGATVLNLAGIVIPKSIDGNAFLGSSVSAQQIDQRSETLGHVDRVDEKYDLVRSLRIGKWKYVRNFEPHYPAALYNETFYQMQTMQQWLQMHQGGELNEVQDAFFLRRTPEALYDLEIDPYETVNLASDDRHAKTLLKIRDRLTERLIEMNDLGFIPEAFLIDGAMTDPVTFGRRNHDVIKRLIQTANLQLLEWGDAKPKILAAINDQDAMVRIWGLVSATWFACAFVDGKLDDFDTVQIIAEAQRRLVDLEPLAVIRAVECLAILGIGGTESVPDQSVPDSRPFLYRSLQRCVSQAEALRVLNTTVFVRDHCFPNYPAGQPMVIDPKQLQLIIPYDETSLIDRRLKHLNQLP